MKGNKKMKKITTLLFAVLLVLMLAACDNNKPADSNTPAAHDHSFTATWVSDDTHHWHACSGEGCTEVSAKSEHTYGDMAVTEPAAPGKEGVGTYTCTVCSATKTEPIPALPAKMSEEAWAALFELLNVRIDCAASDTENGDSYYYLVDGDNVLEVWDEDETYTDRSVLLEVDFTASYNSFVLADDGSYTAESVTVNYMDLREVELTNVKVTLAEGKLSTVSYDMDFGMLGAMSYVYTFSLWGEIEVEAPDTSLRAEVLEYALSQDRFVNFTVDVDVYTYMFAADAYVRLEYDENYEIVDTVSGNAADVKDALLLEITALLSSLSVEDFEYEVLLGEYTYVGESDAFSELTFSLDEEGNLSTVYVLGNDEQITAYWFYDYGTTVLE